MYTVSQAAEVLGVSPHTVRYYDDQGLVPGTVRDAGGQRIFGDMAMEWLFVAITLRRTGLPLAQVRRYEELYAQGPSTVAERHRLMLEQRDRLRARMAELQVSMDLLERKVAYYGRLAEGGEDDWSHEYMQDLIRRSHEVRRSHGGGDDA